MAEAQPPPQKPAGPRRNLMSWVAIAVAILLIIFIGLNSHEVEVDFIFASAQAPLIVALLIAGGLGALIGWLVPRVRRGKD